MPRLPPGARGPIVCALAVIALARFAFCERLPIRAYSTADGLPGNDVNSILKDSRGFLWFATNEGLARFDGYEFSNYTRANGLPRDSVSDFFETRSGVYLAATPDGVAKFDPSAPAAKKFVVYRPKDPEAHRVYVLYQDHAGQLWCGTEGGLFRLRAPGQPGQEWRFEAVPVLPGSGKPVADKRVISLFEDSRRDLWIGTFNALYRRTPRGDVFEYRREPREGIDFLWNVVLEDHAGRLWAGTGSGLWRIAPDGAGDYRIQPVLVPKKRLLIWCMLEDAGGKMWLGTSRGLVEWNTNQDRSKGLLPRTYTEANGLTHHAITVLTKDREGNLWLGTEGSGAMRIGRNGFVTYPVAEYPSLRPFEGTNITLFRGNSGGVYPAFHHVINVLQSDKFVEIIPAIPKQHSPYLGWGWHQTIVQDKTGEWWIPTAEGLVRFPSVPIQALGHAKPKAVYTTRDGLRTNDIFRIFEDSRGGIWVACIGPHGINGLSRWDRGTQSFRHFSEHTFTVASAFAEDRDGSIWIGYYTGDVARFRNGSFTFYGVKDGLAGGGIQALHIDCAGRLWIASSRGLTRVDAPGADSPRFARFGTAEGLSSNIIHCITEDRWGRVYLATGRGIDRISANGRIAPGLVRQYTEGDGLVRGDLRDVMFDRKGVLWCAGKQGISRFTPEPEDASGPPPVFIKHFRVRGIPRLLSDLGETAVPAFKLAPDQNQIQIDFAGLAFAPGQVLRYQYKLEPADRGWSDPSDERTVNYSNVAPGEYRFSVRLITEDLALSRPAILEFAVLAPVWQRWWFRLLLVFCVLALMYWFHRYRTQRLLELERIRTRVASDLHDDIGSGLSQIAVLTEVAQMRADGAAPELTSALSRIGGVSRELTEAMSDIVWSVNPQRDHLSDLVQRMRRFSSDVLSGRAIDFRFQTSVPEQPIQMPLEIRREVYLIFKEAVNNVIRHSGCTRAEVAVAIDHDCLTLRVEDNGKGLEQWGSELGNGLRNMNERAQRIGASIELGPGEQGGVRLVLQASLHPRSHRPHTSRSMAQ